MRILYPGGFDLVHHGHVNALHTARSLGHLMVGVNSDQFMEHYKRKPAHDQQQRLRDVKRLGIADEIFLWDGPEGQAEQILATKPDIYIAGTDWLAKDLAQQLHIPHLSWFDDHNISLMYLRRTQGISTTRLIEQLDNGQA